MLFPKAAVARTAAARTRVANIALPSPARARLSLLLLRASSSSSSSWGGDDDGSSRPPVPWLDSFEVRRSSVSETALDVLGSSDGNGNNNHNDPEASLQSALADHLRDRPVDAVVVLAGGLLPDGGLPPWVTRRLDTAAGVRRLQMRCSGGEGGRDAPTSSPPALAALVPPRPPIVLSGGGTPHKRPPVDPVTGHPLHESTACARYLMRGGGNGAGAGIKGWAVPPGSLLKETSSMDTLGNAYFTMVSQAVPRGWRRLAVVTSSFHLQRAKALFVDIAGATGATLHGDDEWYELTFVGAKDAAGLFALPTRTGSDGPGGVDYGDDEEEESNNGTTPSGAQVLVARCEKEAQSVRDWQRARQEHGGLATLPEISAWLHGTHRCYAAQYQDEFGKRTIEDDALLASY